MDGEFDFGKGAMFFGLICMFIGMCLQGQTIRRLESQLADPHHCVSVCVEEFEKYGC